MIACPDAGRVLPPLPRRADRAGSRPMRWGRVLIDIRMGSVQIGECDVTVHMSLQYSTLHALAALAWLGLELGVGSTY
jgi:hypothetical protein